MPGRKSLDTRTNIQQDTTRFACMATDHRTTRSSPPSTSSIISESSIGEDYEYRRIGLAEASEDRREKRFYLQE